MVWTATARDSTHSYATDDGPRGFTVLSPPWILYFGFVSVVSSPCSYLFTSASVKIPFHAAPKCDTLNLTDMWRSTFEISSVQLRSVTELAPKSPFLRMCEQNPYPVWFSCRPNSYLVECKQNLNIPGLLYSQTWQNLIYGIVNFCMLIDQKVVLYLFSFFAWKQKGWMKNRIICGYWPCY